ncbi:MAG: SRPBCC family protein [Burkholderiaceae bacterium]
MNRFNKRRMALIALPAGLALLIVIASVADNGEPVKISAAIEIAKPLEDVFAFTSNVENDVKWRTNVQSLRNLTPPPTGVGTRSVETLQVLGKPLETVTEVVEFVPNQKIARKTVSGATPVATLRQYEPIAGGTRFTYAVSVDVNGVLLFRLLKPAMKIWYQRKTEQQLQALRALLEAAR